MSEKLKYCEVCEKEKSDLYDCERCERIMCSDCQAKYTQFSQIDYNCCKRCAEVNYNELVIK